ncbi:hypothetical protein O1D97_08325 [Marinomonas sp. 15G1-11]|uniref:Nucleoside transporter/FeoB GTPase Gate domain-containing protein n=1 Tax=Marinomonas phaeophyticola TaxID=3004091 RepID=A0ABT4JTC5_9GAMM|nr:nucleoside recognition domain-containing protein [Marinomonas sp. 15G1-11]MCZ2721660.1 hypothetical protein [Marinomonas sp. 15G1-11]
MHSLKNEVTQLIREIFTITITLFKIMIPAIIIVKILVELGIVPYVAWALEPFMSFVGLPKEASIIWAATMLTSNYTGMVLFFQFFENEPITVAQTTVLASMMLMAHNMPTECAIARKAGVKVLYAVTLRIGAGFLIGWILHLLYTKTGMLQSSNQLIWTPSETDDSLVGWIMQQLESLFYIFVMIAGLVTGLKILKLIGVEALLKSLLSPFLKITGIHKDATSFTLVGMTLGLAFGGGLLINEAKKGVIKKKDIFLSLSLLCLCHSLIEDTILMFLIGADLTSILVFRVIFSFALMIVISQLFKRLPDNKHHHVVVSVTQQPSLK